MLNYRKILLVYIEHVISEEGCDFVDSGVCHDLKEHLNAAEFAELNRLVEEVRGA